MKHTPGPWEILKDTGIGLSDKLSVRTVDKKLMIANKVGPNMEAFHKENIANARLIAAAPDLLKACIGVKDMLEYRKACGEERLGWEDNALVRVTDAIAKATS